MVKMRRGAVKLPEGMGLEGSRGFDEITAFDEKVCGLMKKSIAV